MESLKDKVAIITGGSGGIGMATAQKFLEQGVKVMLVDINEVALKKAILELNNQHVDYCVADVSKIEDTKDYVNDTITKFNKIDILFSNAGVEGVVRPIAEYPESVFDKIIAVNLKGVWLSCKHVIPKMSNGGSVMITSSVAGLKGFAGLGAYVASKHAVVGIMKTAAIENASRKIRVNTIHPGPVNNRMMRAIEKELSPDDPTKAKQGFESNIPFVRYAESEEIADSVLFLASDASRYITGNQLVVDGGMMTA